MCGRMAYSYPLFLYYIFHSWESYITYLISSIIILCFWEAQPFYAYTF